MYRATADCGYRIHYHAMMNVSDDYFLQHIAALRRHYAPVHLVEVIE